MPPKKQAIGRYTPAARKMRLSRAAQAYDLQKMPRPGNGCATREAVKSGVIDYKSPIEYDERLEAGIPDSLLAGLGFSDDPEQSRVSPESDEEMEPMESEPALNIDVPMGLPDSVTSILMNQLSTLAANQGGLANGLTPKQFIDMVKSNKTSSVPRSNNSSGSRSAPRVTTQGNQSSRVSTQGNQSSRVSTQGNQSSRVSTQGNQSSMNRPNPRPHNMNDASISDQAAAMIARAAQQATKSVVANASGRLQAQPLNHTTLSQPRMGQIQPNPNRAQPARGQGTPVRPQGINMQVPGRGRPTAFGSQATTFTKGSIVYEKMPTGEVVASLVKRPAGNTPSSGAPPVGRQQQQQQQAARPQPVTPVMNRTQAQNSNVSRSAPHQQNKSQSSSVMHVPDNCPVNEVNVGDVLERAMGATQSMRVLLASMRDDLRRVGANQDLGGLSPLQTQKRQEIAEKLGKAYTAYKRSIEEMCPFNNGEPNQGSGAPVPLTLSQPRNVAPVQPKPTRVATIQPRPVGLPDPSRVGKVEPPGGERSGGERGRKRGRSGEGGVIELSDGEGLSEDEETAMLVAMATKDPVAEKRSRDQRAADREALRAASIAAEAAKNAKKAADRRSRNSRTSLESGGKSNDGNNEEHFSEEKQGVDMKDKGIAKSTDSIKCSSKDKDSIKVKESIEDKVKDVGDENVENGSKSVKETVKPEQKSDNKSNDSKQRTEIKSESGESVGCES